ncbi:hypothetical protein OAS86_00450 [Gammaproteobacteria bacterium]|nr:hypothetical protein [Gammaproteobacteria bacterium]
MGRPPATLFLEIKAIVFDLNLTLQAGVFFLKLSDTELIGAQAGRWTWLRLGQGSNAALCELTTPLRKLIGVQLSRRNNTPISPWAQASAC